MPPNLTLFCLVSKFHTLVSPTNLKRLTTDEERITTDEERITTDGTCNLCSKDMCTTAHISGACQVLPQQGRYTFRYDTVLHKII